MKTLLRATLSVVMAALLITVCTMGGPAAADTGSILSNNMDQPLWAYDAALTNGVASSFSTMGLSQPYVLKSVTMDAYQTIPANTGPIYVYSNTGGVPGENTATPGLPGSSLGSLALLGSFSTSAGTPTTFTSSGISLAANAYYWIVVLPADLGGMQWGIASTSTGTGTGFQPGFAVSYFGTEPWGYNGSQLGTYGIEFGDTTPYKMLVGEAPVPLPPTLLLLGSGLLSLAVLRRRSKT
jgi:hypothetical protein